MTHYLRVLCWTSYEEGDGCSYSPEARAQKRRVVEQVLMDVLNPSPNQGWFERERDGLLARGKADFVLCLALLHHVRVRGNIPVRAFVAWLAQIGRSGILEYVPTSDPMMQRLIGWRDDIYRDYDAPSVEAALREYFSIRAVHDLDGSGRRLYVYGDA